MRPQCSTNCLMSCSASLDRSELSPSGGATISPWNLPSSWMVSLNDVYRSCFDVNNGAKMPQSGTISSREAGCTPRESPSSKANTESCTNPCRHLRQFFDIVYRPAEREPV